jgi:hypothetical protein
VPQLLGDYDLILLRHFHGLHVPAVVQRNAY